MMPSDEAIYRYLLGDVVVGEMYNSPLPGRKDDTPSFGLYESEGKIKWKDFGYISESGSDAIALLMEMRSLSFGEAKDFARTRIKEGRNGVTLQKADTRRSSLSPTLRVGRLFEDYESDYWGQFYIDEETLLREKIHPLRGLRWSEDSKSLCSTKADPAFAYIFDNGFKIYRPLTEKKKDKWKMWGIKGVIEGINTISNLKSRRLFIASSTKDRLVLKKLGHMAINPVSEGNFKQLLLEKRHIDESFDPIILFDRDKPGLEYAKSLSEKSGWPYIDPFEVFPDIGKDIAEMAVKDFKYLCKLLNRKYDFSF